jgi:alpha-mannosidase
MPIISGELSSGRFSGISSGGLSGRVELKIKNRKLESLLYLAELFITLSNSNDRYPELENVWLKLLFNQDHNILRGICTDEPYELATRRYDAAIRQTEEILEQAISEIASGLSYESENQSYIVFNPLPWNRTDIVRIVVDVTKLENQFIEILDSEGESVPYQIVANQTQEELIEVVFIAENMPSLGYRVYSIGSVQEKPEFNSSIRTGRNWIESDDFIIEIDDFSGAIERIFDKKNQFEVLRGRGNYLVMENDMGDLYRYSRSPLADESADLFSLRSTGKVTILGSNRTLNYSESFDLLHE